MKDNSDLQVTAFAWQRRVFFWLFLSCVFLSVRAQQVALKTNLLGDATLTPNLGVELGVSRRGTVQLFYGFNPWKFSETKQTRHWVLMPEYRFWTCQRFNGHFFGVHAMGGQFNVAGVKLPFGLFDELRDRRYEGRFIGGGVTYGYQWILSRHWNFEASVGVGYDYIKYKEFGCGTCGPKHADRHRHYFGPTKAALSLSYLF